MVCSVKTELFLFKGIGSDYYDVISDGEKIRSVKLESRSTCPATDKRTWSLYNRSGFVQDIDIDLGNDEGDGPPLAATSVQTLFDDQGTT